MTLILGIDVSNYTGEITPQFVQAVKDLGYSHAVVRAGLENQKNKEITRQQLTAFKDGGVTTSIYIWQYYSWSPEQTVVDTAALTDGYPETVWWADCEELQDIGTPPQMVSWLDRYFKEADSLKDDGGIYSAEWWWGEHMGDSTAFATRPWWIADYDGIANPSVFVPVGGVLNPVGKQYRGSGQGVTIYGVGNIDLDVFTDAILPAPIPQPPSEAWTVDANQLSYLFTSAQKQLTQRNPNFLSGIGADIAKLQASLG